MPARETAEWLEADGLGGFASGTEAGIRTRRYHALLLTATTPPTGRYVLVNGFDAWVETPEGRYALTSNRYAPDVVHPDGASRIERFALDAWPRWTFALPGGIRIEQEIVARKGASVVAVTWRLATKTHGVSLEVRPFLSCRDYHSLHFENGAFRFDAQKDGERVSWHPYASLPRVATLSNGSYAHGPEWFRRFLYAEEKTRGLDHLEDLASPGTFRFDLSKGEAVWLLAGEKAGDAPAFGSGALETARELKAVEKRRRARFATPLHRAADAYVVSRGTGQTIVAGYPWFTDWGRDTFIALRGLVLAAGRYDDARRILIEWAEAVSKGMLPNRFQDKGDVPEFNSVDASLWYVVAVSDFSSAAALGKVKATRAEQTLLRDAVLAILDGYAKGTRYGIRMDADGLLAAGAPGVQLTWMDAKVGDWVVTPRIGKPVEIQALWLNALKIGANWSQEWKEAFTRGRRSFRTRFWNKDGKFLYDVVDVDHVPGTADATFRPNQVFAVGGLPEVLLDARQARRVVDAVEARLLTPLGPRSLAPGEPSYTARYEGGIRERDGSYHQGTVWPWLIGPFVEAWVRVRGCTVEAKQEARRRFLEPLLRHATEAGLGHISEIADAEAPHTPRGCPFQAWSVGEVLRLDQDVLSIGSAAEPPARRRLPTGRNGQGGTAPTLDDPSARTP